MFGSDILDIVIGTIFVFLLLSLVCSALNEFLEALVKNRARDLERGIRELIGDPPNATDFVGKLYDHGLINSLYKGSYSVKKKGNLPSYIPAANFALAVIDLVRNAPPGSKLPDNLKAAYAIFERRAAGDEAKLQTSLEKWFNNGMDRVSGWYKRRAQWILVTLGLLMAVALNADTVLIARTLSNDASLRKGLVALAQARAGQPAPTATGGAPGAAATGTGTLVTDGAQIEQDVGALGGIGLPIGWHPTRAGDPAFSSLPLQVLCVRAVHAAPQLLKEHLLGWLLTAIAVSMGAPFWFDLLGKVVALRSTVKPEAQN